MKRREEAIAACMELPEVFEDYPFDDPNMSCMRHTGNQKIFAFIYERGGCMRINLKAEPLKADFWKDAFPAVTPGWHMNKRHWITVLLDGSMEDGDIRMLIRDSYQLTKAKKQNSKA